MPSLCYSCQIDEPVVEHNIAEKVWAIEPCRAMKREGRTYIIEGGHIYVRLCTRYIISYAYFNCPLP